MSGEPIAAASRRGWLGLAAGAGWTVAAIAAGAVGIALPVQRGEVEQAKIERDEMQVALTAKAERDRHEYYRLGYRDAILDAYCGTPKVYITEREDGTVALWDHHSTVTPWGGQRNEDTTE